MLILLALASPEAVAATSPEIDVKSYGALGDGATDDTIAIQSAITAANSTQGGQGMNAVIFPPGQYVITNTMLITANGVHLRGAGEYATRILFKPVANAVPAVRWDHSGTAISFNNSLTGMTIAYADGASLTDKIGIDVVDASQLTVEHVMIIGFDGAGGTGIRTAGREICTFSRIYCSASLPCHITRNKSYDGVTGAYGWLSADHLVLRDCYLHSSGAPGGTLKHACVLIDSDANVSNMSIEGSQAWTGGNYGLYWHVDAGNRPSSASYNFRVENLRTEQPTTPVNYAVLIECPLNAIQNVNINNMYGSTGRPGIRLQGVLSARISNTLIAGSLKGLIIDRVSYLELANFATTGTTELLNMTTIYAPPESALGGANGFANFPSFGL